MKIQRWPLPETCRSPGYEEGMPKQFGVVSEMDQERKKELPRMHVFAG